MNNSHQNNGSDRHAERDRLVFDLLTKLDHLGYDALAEETRDSNAPPFMTIKIVERPQPR